MLSVKRFGSSYPGKKWIRAIKKDDTSISKYGDTDPEENFAEAMRVYIQTDGGTKNPQAVKGFANRFKILDKLMKQSMQKRASLFKKFKKAMEKRGVAFVTRAVALTHVLVKDKVYIIPAKEEDRLPSEKQISSRKNE